MSNLILELKDIKKNYFGVPALNGVDISLKRGEILGLIGENGAGKSTLIKIIAGAIEKTSGELYFEDKQIQLTKPKDAIDLGIGVVYQEFNLFRNLTVYENIFFGVEIKNKAGILDRPEMIKQSNKIIHELGFDFEVTSYVKDLTTAYQQIVEIAKCINRDAKVLIMDEPSAPLTDNEVEKMFHVVNKLNKSGVSIIYISHKLEEILDITNRITVLRDGDYITTLQTKDTNKDELIGLMVGRSVENIYPDKLYSESEIILECKNISGGIIKDVSFNLKKGEVLGFGGLVGAGRTELMRLIFGADHMSSGNIIINGKEVNIHSPVDAIKYGIGLVPEDRKHHGLILNKNIFMNSALPSFNDYSKNLVVNFEKITEEVKNKTEMLRLKANNLEQLAIHLSGGNQQKVVLSKWLIKNSDILILDEPTRGIDVGAKQEFYTIIKELANQGKAVIVVSSEMPELIGVSHRILVMKEGRISGEVLPEEMEQKFIMRLAS